MVDTQVLQVLLDRINALEDAIGLRFDGVNGRLDRVNGRLDKHDTTINQIEAAGCARFRTHLDSDAPHPPSRTRRVAQTGGLMAVAIALFEALKAGFNAALEVFR
jgi:hypothetical protein